LVVSAPDESLLFQRLHVLVNGGQRGELQPRADFLETWRVAVAIDEADQEIEDLLLPARQCHGLISGGRELSVVSGPLSVVRCQSSVVSSETTTPKRQSLDLSSQISALRSQISTLQRPPSVLKSQISNPNSESSV